VNKARGAGGGEALRLLPIEQWCEHPGVFILSAIALKVMETLRALNA
jgi:hypothetical protein